MITLAIETSCDETALCLLEKKNDEYRVLANIVHSQVDIHREYGGVFPTLAKREHIKNLPILYDELIKKSGIDEKDIDQIAVTEGPGLEPALWTGITFAEELSRKLEKPIIPVNHMEGHIVASLVEEISEDFKSLKQIQFPALALLISGGHTEIVHVESFGKYKIVGKTRDDAVGEAFDKVARMLGLPYPGGPEVSMLAEKARSKKIPKEVTLPRPMIHSPNLDFSFSGLKTAVLYTLKKIDTGIDKMSDDTKADICREFEDAVTEVLVSKVQKALEENQAKALIVGGGVIANKHIRQDFEELSRNLSIALFLPPEGLTGDNALMIALASFLGTKKPSFEDLIAKGNLSL